MVVILKRWPIDRSQVEWYSVIYGGRSDKWGNELTPEDWEQFPALPEALEFANDLPRNCRWEVMANTEEDAYPIAWRSARCSGGYKQNDMETAVITS